MGKGLEEGRVLRILDVPLAAWDGLRGAGVDVDCLVAGSLLLSRLERDPAPIRISCDAIGRNGPRRTWDIASSSWRVDVPALTKAETASLLRGVPMPRPLATAGELARMILGSAGMRHPGAPAHAWPMALRRPAQARNRPMAAHAAR
ncbi:hypothetical protein [Aureimonas phyllosphaerae]|uniref:Uncharacterized protein n=1 Tax=Aureimonas phyllosphaerae TaxID=1166078 RepID=A0A7W6BTP2_9HYPH|nr:hypothetical protein [Aureimonas phyllosphaerae]MBB3937851.1 hypothetical protein [Aureimonas phyllosphaerae]MBB3961818.1 hypothetical protein [Aureimonas phyllosphaerae]